MLPRTVIVAIVVGTVVTFVSAFAPARRAARVPPVAAMRDAEISAHEGSRRYWIGGGFSLLGAALLVLGLFGDVSSSDAPGGAAGLVGGAAFLMFIGVAMLSPLVARPVALLLGWFPARVRGTTGVLARENAARNPRRTATTAAALMIGLGLVSFVAIFGASIKDSFAHIIDDTVKADFLVTGGFEGFPSEAATAIRDALPDAQVVEFRNGSFQLDGSTKQLLAVGPNVGDGVDIKLRPGADLAEFADGGVLIYKDAAAENGWKVGDQLQMRFEKTGVVPVTVQGIFDENRTVGTSYLLSLDDYESNYTDQLDSLVAVRRPDGMSAAVAKRALDRALKPFPTVDAKDQTQYKDDQLMQINTLLNLLYALLLLAVLIALIGIVNTLALSIHERTRELGLLRAVGMTKAQVRTMVRDEAVIVAVFGSLLGLLVGIGFGRAIVAALSDDGITFTVPVIQLAVFVLLAGLAGFVAGAWPAWQASKRDVLESIASE